MTCTKTENGLLFSKDGKEVLVEDVSHPHFAKHVAVSFSMADIEATETEVLNARNEGIMKAAVADLKRAGCKTKEDFLKWEKEVMDSPFTLPPPVDRLYSDTEIAKMLECGIRVEKEEKQNEWTVRFTASIGENGIVWRELTRHVDDRYEDDGA